jgi:hypothetical protein
MKKRFIFIIGILAVVSFSYFVFNIGNSGTNVASAAKKTYSGILYIAGMGGHFAKADVTIDPNDSENPIKINGDLSRVVIGKKETHPTHDARIDADDRNVMFWSTFKADPDGKMHVGKSDLKTKKVIKDVAVPIDARSKGPAPIYCASGQSKTAFIPSTMATESYIDVFDKKDLTHKHRIFLDEIGYKAGTYKFFHGTNTPDMKGFIVIINQAEGGKGTGKIDLLMLDLPSLENGKVKVLAKNTITGEPDKSIAFRQYFTKDGKLLLQAGGDRMYLIDAKTLKPLDEEMVTGENHDVMPTPDGKYAIVTLRQKIKDEEGKDITDGTLQLYDMEAKKLIGKSVSVCYTCHVTEKVKGSAVLCGLDGNWK